MDNSIKISYFRYDYVIPLIIINLILLTLGMPWVEFSAVISLITLIIVIIGTRVTLSDRRKKIIEELKQDNFIDYVILSLKANCELYEKKVTQNYQVTASYQNLNKFSRAYPF
ncbi:MAG: hypothetical protein IMZ52_03360, partial [Actinobacteria bacterium]|nr:hypothetical protein [Actinomycetota bacterium]